MDAVMRRSVGFLMVSLTVLTVGCKMFGSKDQQPPSTDAVIPAPAYLPGDRAVDKWDRYDKVRNYNADNLYLALGSSAQSYRDYGIQELVQTRYRVGLEGTETLDVQVFRMKDNVNAFGVYSIEHNKEAQPVEAGARGCASDLTADVYKGQHYVRLRLDKTVPDSQDSLARFAAWIAGKLPGNNSLPALLSAFPEKDRVANSEQYLAPDTPGQTYLKGGYRVLYESEGKKFSMFLTNSGTPDDALWTMSGFRMSFENTGSAEALLPGPWTQAFWGLDPELGRALVFRKGSYIGGTMGLADKKLAEEMSAQLAKSLP